MTAAGQEAVIKLIVQLGEAVRVFDSIPGAPEGFDALEVTLRGLTLGQARAAYRELHRSVLGVSTPDEWDER